MSKNTTALNCATLTLFIASVVLLLTREDGLDFHLRTKADAAEFVAGFACAALATAWLLWKRPGWFRR